ncbi:abscission/NoCut checkpoint regulator isoform X2 [Rhinatrema bivittatum]|uniref:abscission/NoCut checkpoint regulator isoform X2 n=1 Tax=Rhinatrema bivittatum TaxID=194408 RepID=UPI00112D127F|nr:abscission/NoCut checkpoint regulator isoform X2 [Rhinatrema bivittatum]
MNGRCYGCASKFTVFKKELGCKNCGRSFCSGCLTFTAIVPRYGNTKQKVCRQCHGEITSGVSQKNNLAKWSPPENYKKRVAAFEEKQNQLGGSQQGSLRTAEASGPRYENLSKEDRVIAERLDRLKRDTQHKNLATNLTGLGCTLESVPSLAEMESRLAALKSDPMKPVPSTQEMEDRLAVLQGRTPPSKTPTAVHQPPDNRPQAQRVDDLLTQLSEEVSIDENYNPGAQSEDVSTFSLNDLNRGSERNEWKSSTAALDPKQLEEEKNRLLAEAASELREENTRQEKILEVAKRLAVLQGKDPDKITLKDYNLPDSDEEMEEEAIQRVLKQLSEEAALDEISVLNIPLEETSSAVPSEPNRSRKAAKVPAPLPEVVTRRPAQVIKEQGSDEEELPWCCICNEDATLRCYDCDDDLYCQRCFREGHDEFERKEHRTSSYCPPRKRK